MGKTRLYYDKDSGEWKRLDQKELKVDRKTKELKVDKETK